MSDLKPYRPSNSDEGIRFIGKFCANCIRGKYEHTQDTDDHPCDILSNSFFGEAKEWVYDQEGKPTCLAFKLHHWEQDENGKWNDPPVSLPPDPNQIALF